MSKKQLTSKIILEAFQRPDGRASERAENVAFARMAAGYIRLATDSWRALAGVDAADKSDETTRAIESVKESWCFAGLFISSANSPADVLRRIADALEGKSPVAAKNDDAIREAWEAAALACKRYDERSINFLPLFSEVWDAFDKGPSVHWSRPHKDYLRRRLKILGLPLSKKQGRHRDKNATARITRNCGKG